jgi:Ca-activated chloride channel family protein
MNGFNLKLTPLRAGLQAGVDNVVDVMVTVEAPDAPKDLKLRRPPLNLALVIDRSGSMAGRPLHEAKRCAVHVIERLTPRDRVALVMYDDAPAVIAASQAVTDRQALADKVGRVHSGGCTNLHGGWLAGAEQVSPHLQKDTISRVMLLSDGLANRGLTDREAIFDQCSSLAAAGVSTSTYGLGNQFDEELLTGMARAGSGNAYYGQSAEDLMDPIEEELQLLAALCARKVQVAFDGPAGATVEVLNALRRPGPGVVDLPDLAYDSQAWVMLRIRIGRERFADRMAGAKFALLQVEAGGTLFDGTPLKMKANELELPILTAQDFDALPEDERVKTRLTELQVAQIEREARQAAQEGNWTRVDALMTQALAAGVPSAWAQRTTLELQKLAEQRDVERMKKESLYAAFRKESRLVGKSPDLQVDGEHRPFLREKPLQGRSET